MSIFFSNNFFRSKYNIDFFIAGIDKRENVILNLEGYAREIEDKNKRLIFSGNNRRKQSYIEIIKKETDLFIRRHTTPFTISIPNFKYQSIHDRHSPKKSSQSAEHYHNTRGSRPTSEIPKIKEYTEHEVREIFIKSASSAAASAALTAIESVQKYGF